MKKITSGMVLFILVVLYGGRAALGRAQDTSAPGSADQAAQQSPDQSQQAQDQANQNNDANAGDFDADVNAGEQQLAQDPSADLAQVSIINSEDQSAGDPTNSDVPEFTGIDQAQADSQSATPNDDDNVDLSTSEVTQEPDAGNLSADTQNVIDDQQQADDQQSQDQQAQDQQNQDQTQQGQSEQPPDQSQQSLPVDTGIGQ